MFNGNGGHVNGGGIPDEEVEEAQDLQPLEHNGCLQPIEHNGGLQQMEPNGGLQQMEPNGGLQQIEPNGGLQPIEPNGVQQIEPNGVQQIEPNGGLQQIEPNGVQQIEPNGGLQQIEPNGGLQQIEPNGVQHIEPNGGLQQMEHNGGLQQIHHNGGLQQPGQNGDHHGLQQTPHVQEPSLIDYIVNLDWLTIYNATVSDEPEPSSGLQLQNGAQGDVNGSVGESDEEEEAAHSGEAAELETEAFEDLGPYWVDVDNGEEEQWNLLNIDPPPDEFFDGVYNDNHGIITSLPAI